MPGTASMIAIKLYNLFKNTALKKG